MKRLGEYRSYLLYEVEEQDGRDINTSSGSRYIRNSILIFKPDENNPKLGDEWRMCKNEEEAKRTIDESAPKMPIQEQMKQAEERSRARAAAMDIQRRAKLHLMKLYQTQQQTKSRWEHLPGEELQQCINPEGA